MEENRKILFASLLIKIRQFCMACLFYLLSSDGKSKTRILLRTIYLPFPY